MLPCSWVSHMQCCYYYILLGLGHIIIYCNTHNIRREEEQACMYAFTFYQSVCISPPGCLPPVPGLLWSHSQRPAVPGHLVQVTWSRWLRQPRSWTAGLQSADDRVMSAFHNTRIIRVKGNQVIPWDASFSIGNWTKCHKTSQTKCKVVINCKLLNMSTSQCSSLYLDASLHFSYRFSDFWFLMLTYIIPSPVWDAKVALTNPTNRVTVLQPAPLQKSSFSVSFIAVFTWWFWSAFSVVASIIHLCFFLFFLTLSLIIWRHTLTSRQLPPTVPVVSYCKWQLSRG